MKVLTRIALAALSIAFVTNAFAQTSTPSVTRADVRQQLIEAEKAGLLPSTNNDYPPGVATIERNREVYAIQNQPSRHDAFADVK